MSCRRLERYGTWLAVAVLGGCTYGATEVVVTLDTNAPIDRTLAIDAVVSTSVSMPGMPSSSQSESMWIRGGAIGTAVLPGSFAVTPGSADPNSVVTLTITASLAAGSSGEPEVEFRRIARFGFAEHQSTAFGVYLNVACGTVTTGCANPSTTCTLAQLCEDQGLTCGDDATCVSPMVTPVPFQDAATPIVHDVTNDVAPTLDVPMADATADVRLNDAPAMDMAHPTDAVDAPPTVDSVPDVSDEMVEAAVDAPPPPVDVISGTDGPDPLSVLDDPFTSTTLNPMWSIINGTCMTYTPGTTDLTIAPTCAGQWFMGTQSDFIWEQINTASFMVSVDVTVRSDADPTMPPTELYRSGGVMARDPSRVAMGENHVLMAVGSFDMIGRETKNTVNSMSTYMSSAWASADGRVRVCRVGSTFMTLWRPLNGTSYTMYGTYTRTDMPNALQIGVFSELGCPPYDFFATFANFEVRTVNTTSDCYAMP